MRPALAYLFDECENEELQNAVCDNAALKQLRTALTAAREPTDRMSAPAGDRGDNLILGLIALRLKFPRVDAEQKLERNLTLRDQR
ncbi:hypothetical protein BH20CHL4_BH20CHL4_02510 [soil metagenome]